MFYGYLLKVGCEMFVVFDYILYNFLMRQFILTSTYIIINYLSSKGILLLMKHLMPCIELHNSHGLYHIIYCITGHRILTKNILNFAIQCIAIVSHLLLSIKGTQSVDAHAH